MGLQVAIRYHSLFEIVAPLVLIALGIVYIIIHLKMVNRHHHDNQVERMNRTSVTAFIISLAVRMFFPPWIKLESSYLKAGKFGWQRIYSVSIIVIIVTVSMIFQLVYLALKGIDKFKFC